MLVNYEMITMTQTLLNELVKKFTSSYHRQGKKDDGEEGKIVKFFIYLLRLPTVKACLNCCDTIGDKSYILLQSSQPTN